MGQIRGMIQGGLGNQLFQLLRLAELADGKTSKVVLDVSLLALRGPTGAPAQREFECYGMARALGWSVTRSRLMETQMARKAIGLVSKRSPSSKVCGRETLWGAAISDYRPHASHSLIESSIVDNHFHGRQILDRQAVHLRLGDYVALSHVYGRPDGKYYREAFERSMDRDTKIVVFSDEPDVAVAWFASNVPGYKYVAAGDLRWPETNDNGSWKDLLRLACCSSLVTGNSTFGWWATWIASHCIEGRKALFAPLSMHPTGLAPAPGVNGVEWSVRAQRNCVHSDGSLRAVGGRAGARM
jgi:hypothetical protein